MNFHQFAQAHGLLIRDLRDDGNIHRCPTESKPRSDNGAYAFDGRRGWVMDWQVGGLNWWNDPESKPFTEQEKAAWKKRQQDQAKERAAKAAKAAQEARRMIDGAMLVVPRARRAWAPGRPEIEEIPGHPYLIRKGFPMEPCFVMDGDLLVPMFDAQAYHKPIGLQRITPAGEKKFLLGQRAKGAIFRIGSGRSRHTWLCEGYATALSIREALKHLRAQADVVACFSAANLTHIASLGIGSHVFADHDASETGANAAKATGLPWVMWDQEGDANDMHMAQGIRAVAELMRGAM